MTTPKVEWNALVRNMSMDGLRAVKHLFVTWNVAGVKLTTHKDHHQSETCKMKAA